MLVSDTCIRCLLSCKSVDLVMKFVYSFLNEHILLNYCSWTSVRLCLCDRNKILQRLVWKYLSFLLLCLTFICRLKSREWTLLANGWTVNYGYENLIIMQHCQLWLGIVRWGWSTNDYLSLPMHDVRMTGNNSFFFCCCDFLWLAMQVWSYRNHWISFLWACMLDSYYWLPMVILNEPLTFTISSLGMRQDYFMHWTLVAQTSASSVYSWVGKKSVLLNKNLMKLRFLHIWWLGHLMWVSISRSIEYSKLRRLIFYALKVSINNNCRHYLILLLRRLQNLLLPKVKIFNFPLVDKESWVSPFRFQLGNYQLHQGLSLNGQKASL